MIVSLILPRAPTSTLFPYTTLFRSQVGRSRGRHGGDRRERDPSRPDRPGDRASRGAVEAWTAQHRRGGGERSGAAGLALRSEEHTSELQSLRHLVCRLLLEKKKNTL